MRPAHNNAPAMGGRGVGQTAGRAGLQPHGNPVDVLLHRLDGVKRSGKGWRAKCPACGGGSQKLSIAEADTGAVLLHCFAGCTVADVVHATGLEMVNLFPPRAWPQSPDDRRANRRALQESGWRSALNVLALEACIVQAAARMVAAWQPLTADDDARLQLAIERVDGAKAVLCGR